MRSAAFAAVLLLAGCGSTNPYVDCSDLHGTYVFDVRECSAPEGSLRSKGIEVTAFPDGTPFPAEPVIFAIQQDACSRVSIDVRDMNDQLLRGIDLQPGTDPSAPHWDEGALTHHETQVSGQAPLLMGSHRGRYWSLAQSTTGKPGLTYIAGYEEQGFFLLVPYSAKREVRCAVMPMKW